MILGNKLIFDSFADFNKSESIIYFNYIIFITFSNSLLINFNNKSYLIYKSKFYIIIFIKYLYSKFIIK